MAVGNDIVDLDDPALCGRALDGRFVARVCAPEERARLAAAADPYRLLCRLWTAKESAYKLAQRDDWDLGLAHARFVVDVDAARVRWGARLIRVRWQEAADWLACVAWSGDDPDAACATVEPVAPSTILSARERASAGEPPSVAVRVLAKRLVAERLGLDARELEIVRPPRAAGHGRAFGPPEVWWRGVGLPSVTVSLSHDGRYVAAAVG
jgi:phosphopantetheinyl transferase (holo-ACP synthase)